VKDISKGGKESKEMGKDSPKGKGGMSHMFYIYVSC
jgi:hypothetical protein